MDLNIKDKYAIVTGGSHGIGLATASSLANEGCNVAICGRRKDQLNKAKMFLSNKGVKILTIRTDITKTKDIEKFVNIVINEWQTIDILINNAGGGGRWGDDEFLSPQNETVWYDVLNKNFFSLVNFVNKVLPFMIKQQWGRIVVVTSIYGIVVGGRPWFNVAKTAQEVFIKNIAHRPEFARKNITFNTVAPGDIMIADTGWDEKRKNDPNFSSFLNKYPMGRMGTAEEIANVIVFLCSHKASHINAATIVVDGAQTDTRVI